ncbi:MAG: ThiF family adenylyltransferase [Planctomycetota bacterium]|nr:ThiF family adenylyltransferase [Planctomycetota bacterium]
MPDETIKISAPDVVAERDDRFHRFGLISWWDQAKLAQAKVLVVGAGALGNEIVKNLALLGVGNVLIADLDRIENSNLSRSVLYRASDNGKFKADVAAKAARDIYPGMKTHAFNGNVVYDLGIGVFRWADVVIGGLDNREARLVINRNCQKVNRPWVDGAIETIAGTARVFAPGEGPCYECTMSKTDWQLLQNRRSCNLLTRAEMQHGKTPTTPTISSIIAGVQCQEAVKLIHGMPTIAGQGWMFAGITADSYLVEYQRKQDCLSHETLSKIQVIDAGVDDVTVAELLAEARGILGTGASLELCRDILKSLDCPKCGRSEEMFVSLGRVRADKANCPHCGDVRREVKTFYRIEDESLAGDRTLGQIGVPPWDIVIGRAAGAEAIGFEFAGDRPRVLGPLAEEVEELSWE